MKAISDKMKDAGMGSVPVIAGCLVLVAVIVLAVAAPLLTKFDPIQLAPQFRLRAPTTEFWMGTDMLGRDVWTRVIYGGRVALLIGASVVVVSLAVGIGIGLLSGYFPALDKILMRIMDGVMAIPGILLAIALVSLSGTGVLTVIVAIAVPEVPRVARLVRGVALSIREEPFVEAAIGVGTPTVKVLWRHILPNTLAPIIVQGTYIFAAAMLTEATLSFIGAGPPAEVPTWGNVIADGRAVFQRAPWIILYPGFFLAATILSVNVLGDHLRDTLDPRNRGKIAL
ncbi:ABC transporter permease [Bradyrhizobium sp. KB893862 SZCCT0404]|uniref:ABC transporter permease n=1 Tax=Bradyrhizobium sp. KB893862 SZCCT0404 TaxID=2807672 RepID=UPI001BA4D255|nr:ABC transporter permease [Bradyrhizobium sp. KB893862 SZCCT0404]MBR1177155.1 ABC transporter permease [Bradyrhizobium sp. KB893862 SZCCT0404]